MIVNAYVVEYCRGTENVFDNDLQLVAALVLRTLQTYMRLVAYKDCVIHHYVINWKHD